MSGMPVSLSSSCSVTPLLFCRNISLLYPTSLLHQSLLQSLHPLHHQDFLHPHYHPHIHCNHCHSIPSRLSILLTSSSIQNYHWLDLQHHHLYQVICRILHPHNSLLHHLHHWPISFSYQPSGLLFIDISPYS